MNVKRKKIRLWRVEWKRLSGSHVLGGPGKGGGGGENRAWLEIKLGKLGLTKERRISQSFSSSQAFERTLKLIR